MNNDNNNNIIIISLERYSCAYCHLTFNTDNLNYCYCDTYFCNYHNNYPCYLKNNTKDTNAPNKHNIKYTIVPTNSDINNNTKIKIISKNMNNKEIEEEEMKIEKRLFLNEDLVECPHYNKEFKDKNHIEDNIDKCKCNINKNLYKCITCNFVGCGRKQYGEEGNGCALEHYNTTKHNIVYGTEKKEYYCYKCDGYIYSPDNNKNIENNNKNVENNNKNVENDENTNNNTTENKTINTNLLPGIINIGNSCYISSVMQLLGCIYNRTIINTDYHFMSCRNNKILCFSCQFLRFINGYYIVTNRSKSDGGEDKYIFNIKYLIRIIEEGMGLTGGGQEDASELLVFIINKLRLCESMGEIEGLSIFDISLCDKGDIIDGSSETVVLNDNKANGPMEIQSMLSLPFTSSISCSLSQYFKRSRMMVAPRCLLVMVNRSYFDNGKLCKIDDDVFVDEVLDVCSYLGDVIVDDGYVELLTKEYGFENEKVRKILRVCSNDLEKSINMLLSGDDGGENKYKYLGSVVHMGINALSGHYVCCVDFNGRMVLADDEEIKYGGDIGKSYILAYVRD